MRATERFYEPEKLGMTFLQQKEYISVSFVLQHKIFSFQIVFLFATKSLIIFILSEILLDKILSIENIWQIESYKRFNFISYSISPGRNLR